MAKPSMKAEIARLEAEIISWQGRTWKADDNLEIANRQLANFRAENDALRKDKDWLQRMHSAVLQSMHEFVRGRN